VKLLVAVVIGIASAAGPVGAAAAGFAGPYVPEIFGKLLGRVPGAVLVPVSWYERAAAALGSDGLVTVQEASGER
jgi:hypothetical protein